jgi:hypothetical protein
MLHGINNIGKDILMLCLLISQLWNLEFRFTHLCVVFVRVDKRSCVVSNFINVVTGPNVPRALVVAAKRWLIRPS